MTNYTRLDIELIESVRGMTVKATATRCGSCVKRSIWTLIPGASRWMVIAQAVRSASMRPLSRSPLKRHPTPVNHPGERWLRVKRHAVAALGLFALCLVFRAQCERVDPEPIP